MVWLRQLLPILQKYGVLAHVEPVFTSTTTFANLKGARQPKKLRLYLRYISGRPATRVWVSTTAGQRTHKPSLRTLKTISQTYAGLQLVLSTPRGFLTLEDCIRLQLSGTL